ncbi:DNA-binding transcriptional regulator, LysR family [Amphritea atlantica]|uniref:DNA-binding transcriptional regulator, LysR family n=1 Tax=Amphritea atlantica TaxID=355243 RepID=A0A1H9CZY4_9GAMM|nr:LysR family transcriptional regulator [Amphritea atlantica]SEQ06780.1 DNA-binding transcriptional regulator, LysR family [Amphritea atlantica]
MELARINLNLLISLYYLLHSKSVTAAATAQHISQPAMSRNLHQLREIFNDQLMVRVGNSMHLTPRGEQLWLQLPEALNHLESLLIPGQFEPAGYIGEFNIATTDFITHDLMPPLIAALQQDAPGISLHFHLWHPGMMESLRQGRMDLAACILDSVPDDIYGKQLGSGGYSCLINRHHPLADQPLTLSDYTHADHIGISAGGDKIRAVDEALQTLNQQRNMKLTVPFIHSAMAITSKANYILTLPTRIAEHLGPEYGLKIKPLPQQLTLPASQYYLIWHQRLQGDPAHRYLRERMLHSLSE